MISGPAIMPGSATMFNHLSSDGELRGFPGSEFRVPGFREKDKKDIRDEKDIKTISSKARNPEPGTRNPEP